MIEAIDEERPLVEQQGVVGSGVALELAHEREVSN